MDQPQRRITFLLAPAKRYLSLYEGNKWSWIAAKLGCRSDNCIKNKYYSTMRKGYRKLNRYITVIKRKKSAPHLFCNKLIKPEFLVKLNAVVDGTYAEKYEVKEKAVSCSRGRLGFM